MRMSENCRNNNNTTTLIIPWPLVLPTEVKRKLGRLFVSIQVHWSIKHVTVIPKSNDSIELSQYRNISCTNFLSKVYETFVLQWARQKVTPKSNQYEGEPGCGTTHFLVETVDFITFALEDNRVAAVLTSVNFSKAFNCLEHLSCLKSFALKGASTQIIELLACSMSGRTMTVKVGNVKTS